MTDFSDFKQAIAEWANRSDWSDVLVTSFVRSAEEKLNAELRIDRQITTALNMVTNRCAALPDNWLESDLVMVVSSMNSGWCPIRYSPRDEFFRMTDADAAGFYTIEGRTMFFGGVPDDTEGTQFRLDYYAEVPVFSDDQSSWVYSKYPSLYRYAALMHADLHAVGEEQTASMMKQLAEDMIQKLNAQHRYARASGSRLARMRVRSFG